jgi:hypothetical protein
MMDPGQQCPEQGIVVDLMHFGQGRAREQEIQLRRLHPLDELQKEF